MGALTSKPYAFSARPWELESRSFYDYLDSTHSPIQVSVFGAQIGRVTPSLKYLLRDEWISDRARFGYDSFFSQPNFGFGLSGRFFNKIFSARPFIFAFDYLFFRVILRGCFFLDFSSFYHKAFLETSLARLGLGSGPETLKATASASNFAPRSLIFNISLRYTHPSYFASFVSQKGPAQVFEAGNVTHASEFSLGSGISSSVDFFRFRSRLSAISNTFSFITSTRIYKYFSSVFSLFPGSSHFVSESPFSDFSSSPLVPKFTARFFHTPLRGGFDILFFSPHPYSIPFFSYNFSGKAIYSNPVFSNPSGYSFFNDFVTNAFRQTPDLHCYPLPTSFCIPAFISTLNSSYFLYDHFFGFATSTVSRNLLLSYHQLDEYQQSHFRFF